MRDLDFAVPFRRDDSLGIGRLDDLAQVIGVVSLVRDDAASFLALQEVGGCGDVMGFATGQDETQGPAFGIGEGMNFGGQSPSGTPQSLVFGPPFPLAAC